MRASLTARETALAALLNRWAHLQMTNLTRRYDRLMTHHTELAGLVSLADATCRAGTDSQSVTAAVSASVLASAPTSASVSTIAAVDMLLRHLNPVSLDADDMAAMLGHVERPSFVFSQSGLGPADLNTAGKVLLSVRPFIAVGIV
jgi:hypothetical protein